MLQQAAAAAVCTCAAAAAASVCHTAWGDIRRGPQLDLLDGRVGVECGGEHRLQHSAQLPDRAAVQLPPEDGKSVALELGQVRGERRLVWCRVRLQMVA
jgi:hypothetical protein